MTSNNKAHMDTTGIVVAFLGFILFFTLFFTYYINNNDKIIIDKYGEDQIDALNLELDRCEDEYKSLLETKQVVCEYKDGNWFFTLLGGFIAGIVCCFYAIWVFELKVSRKDKEKKVKSKTKK